MLSSAGGRALAAGTTRGTFEREGGKVTTDMGTTGQDIAYSVEARRD